MAKALGDIIARQLRTSGGKADSRTKLIGAVRAAAKRMQLEDDDRRAIQIEVTGKASLADMTPAEIGKVLDRLNRDRPAPMAHRAHVGKIKALWWTCYWLGAIDEPNDQALDAFVKRQTGVSTLRFVDHRKAPPLIEALKAMAARAGVQWTSEEGYRVNALKGITDRSLVDRQSVISAIWMRLVHTDAVYSHSASVFLAKTLNLDMSVAKWSARETDDCIRYLGKMLRRELMKARGQ